MFDEFTLINQLRTPPIMPHFNTFLSKGQKKSTEPVNNAGREPEQPTPTPWHTYGSARAPRSRHGENGDQWRLAHRPSSIREIVSEVKKDGRLEPTEVIQRIAEAAKYREKRRRRLDPDLDNISEEETSDWDEEKEGEPEDEKSVAMTDDEQRIGLLEATEYQDMMDLPGIFLPDFIIGSPNNPMILADTTFVSSPMSNESNGAEDDSSASVTRTTSEPNALSTLHATKSSPYAEQIQNDTFGVHSNIVGILPDDPYLIPLPVATDLETCIIGSSEIAEFAALLDGVFGEIGLVDLSFRFDGETRGGRRMKSEVSERQEAIKLWKRMGKLSLRAAKGPQKEKRLREIVMERGV